MSVKTYFFFFLLLILPYSALGQRKTTIPQKQNSYVNNLREDIKATNKNLPRKERDGLWSWSAQMIDNTIVYTYKMGGVYLQSSTKEYFSKMTEEYAKSLSKTIGNEINQWVSNKIYLKLRYISEKDNSLIYEGLFSPYDLKRYQNMESTYKGHRPLSYYKNGFEAQNSSLPEKIDDYITFVSVKMENNLLNNNYYVDDNYANSLISESPQQSISYMRKELIKYLNDYLKLASKEMKEDMFTYNVIFKYNYIFQSSKKLAFAITIKCSEDLIR